MWASPSWFTQCFCRAFNMPKANSRQVQGLRIPGGDYNYATWTVTRLRQELDMYDVWPGSWIKKSGLVSLLKTAIKQHDDRDGAPPVAHRGRTRGGRACAANEDVGNEVEVSNGVRINPLPIHQNVGMAKFAVTITQLESSVSLLNTTVKPPPPLPQQAPAAQPRDVISRAAQDSGTHPWRRTHGIPHLRLTSRRTLCLVPDPGPRCQQGFPQLINGSRARLTPLVRRNGVCWFLTQALRHLPRIPYGIFLLN